MASSLSMRGSVFKILVKVRLDDASALLRTRKQARRNGAIYLGGYAVECALKARVCIDRGDSFLALQFWTHDLARLIAVTQKMNVLRCNAFWNEQFKFINSTWRVSLRYDASVLSEEECKRFLIACAGFSKWLLNES